jgi:hypothetical protein
MSFDVDLSAEARERLLRNFGWIHAGSGNPIVNARVWELSSG